MAYCETLIVVWILVFDAMIELAMAAAIAVIPVGWPLMFLLGYGVARWHIRRLAVHGGEQRYPAIVQETVEAYREANAAVIESKQYYERL